MRRLIAASMEALTEKQRQAIEMYYLEGMKMPEIADILGIKKMTVCKRIHVSLQKIKKIKDIFEKVSI